MLCRVLELSVGWRAVSFNSSGLESRGLHDRSPRHSALAAEPYPACFHCAQICKAGAQTLPNGIDYSLNCCEASGEKALTLSTSVSNLRSVRRCPGYSWYRKHIIRVCVLILKSTSVCARIVLTDAVLPWLELREGRDGPSSSLGKQFYLETTLLDSVR